MTCHDFGSYCFLSHTKMSLELIWTKTIASNQRQSTWRASLSLAPWSVCVLFRVSVRAHCWSHCVFKAVHLFSYFNFLFDREMEWGDRGRERIHFFLSLKVIRIFCLTLLSWMTVLTCLIVWKFTPFYHFFDDLHPSISLLSLEFILVTNNGLNFSFFLIISFSMLSYPGVMLHFWRLLEFSNLIGCFSSANIFKISCSDCGILWRIDLSEDVNYKAMKLFSTFCTMSLSDDFLCLV